jgi:hypothetical protein
LASKLPSIIYIYNIYIPTVSCQKKHEHSISHYIPSLFPIVLPYLTCVTVGQAAGMAFLQSHRQSHPDDIPVLNPLWNSHCCHRSFQISKRLLVIYIYIPWHSHCILILLIIFPDNPRYTLGNQMCQWNIHELNGSL